MSAVSKRRQRGRGKPINDITLFLEDLIGCDK